MTPTPEVAAVVGETAGWAYFNEDTGMEWSRYHPVESGEVPDATEIERMTYDAFRTVHGYADWLDTDDQLAVRQHLMETHDGE